MRRPRCTPSAQTEQTSGHTFLRLPWRACDPYARGLAGLALNFLVSRASGRSIARDIYLNRRLGPNCLVGTWFQLSTPHSLVVIPNRQADTTIST